MIPTMSNNPTKRNIANFTQSACGRTRDVGRSGPNCVLGGGIDLSSEVFDNAQPRDSTTAALKETAESDHKIDHWLDWLLALAAIAVPVIVLFCAASIPKDSPIWSQVAIAIRRGEFLVPVLILSLDTTRRWLKEVKCGPLLRIVKFVACVLCIASSFICLVATSQAASLAITADSGKAIEQITMTCIAVPVTFGTFAVSASARRSKSDDRS
jgi:hypothetical protein